MATVQFYGETFDLRPRVSQYRLFKFARAAAREKQDKEAGTMAGWAALLDLVEKCVAPEDWERFDRVADENDADEDSLVKVIQAAFEQEAERPTGRSSDSSDGPSSTPQKSESSTGAKVSDLFPGRPDMQIAALRTATTA